MGEITRGAITHIFETSDTTGHPVLQIIELKKISQSNANPNAAARYRSVLSDGEKFQDAMLATQLNQKVVSGELQLNYLVRLQDYICNQVGNKRLIIILNLDVVSTTAGRIGNPVHVDSKGAAPITNNATPPSSAVTAPSGNGAGKQNGGAWNAVPPSNAYGSNPAPSPARPYGASNGAISSMNGSTQQSYRPIQSINPYQNGWTIRGRCTYKNDMRSWQNARGSGQVISFELTDESGSIRVTAFTEQAQRVNDTVSMGRLYSVTRGNLKHANEKYNRSTSQYEMTIDGRSEFSEIPDDGNTIKVKYNFSKIAALENVEVKGSCDVVGIVQAVGPLGEITLRSTGEPCTKRNITICDDSNASVELTLWRNQAENFLKEEDESRHPILLIKNAVRGDYGGVSLNIGRNSAVELDPVGIPEADQLRAWYDSQGGGQSMTQMTAGRSGGKVSGERKSLEEARQEDVDPVFGGGGGAQASFVMRGLVSFIKGDGEISYPSDPDTKKKVALVSPGIWHSPSSDRQLRDDEVVHRYIMNLKLSDHTGSQWMTAFDESAAVILGKSAGEMRTMKDNDRIMYESVIDDAKFRPLLVRVQVREDEYKGESKIRYTMSRCEPIDFAAECRTLIDEIKAYDS